MTGDDNLWRALANPVRRQLLDALREGPRTTGQLSAAVPSLSRYAVMQHLGVLTDAGLVVARRRGRERFNHLNPVPLRRVYERWVHRIAGSSAAELLALERVVDSQGDTMTNDQPRTLRIESELSFRTDPAALFDVLTQRTLEWFPHTYGGDRTKAVVFEPRVGGALYEDWGDGAGHLYGWVTAFDPPHGCALRTWLMPGTTMDTRYALTEEGEQTTLSVSRVVVGPVSDEEAAGISQFGDLANFADAIRAVVEAA